MYEGSPRIGVCCLCQDTLSFFYTGRVLPHGSFIEGLEGDFRKDFFIGSFFLDKLSRKVVSFK